MRSDGTITIGAKIDTKEFDKQIDYIESRMEEIEHLLKQADLGFEVGDTQKLENEYEKLSNRLVDLRKKKKEISEQPLDDGGVSNKNFEKGIERITKKITRMGLAMIGIRSLYGMISSSVSRITEENPLLQAQIDAIKNAIDNIVARLVDLLLPVIQFIVGLIGKLLKSLFGIDIFAKSFNKNMKGANGSVSKIRKQLLGFDELNILNKDGTTGSLGGGSLKVNAPTDINLGNIKKKIQDFFDRNGININLDYVKDALKHPIEYIKTALDHFILPGIGKGEGLSGMSGLIFGEDSAITKAIKFLHRTFLGGIPGIINNAKNIWEWLFGKNKRGTINDLKEILKSTTGMTSEMSKKIKDEFSQISVTYKNGMYEVTTKTGQVVSMTETEFRELMQVLGKDADFVLDAMVNATAGVQGAFDNLDDKSSQAFDNIKNNSSTSSNNTKLNWFDTINSIINKASGKDQNGLVGAVTGAFNTINNESNKDNNETKTNWIKSANDIILKYTSKDKNGVVGAVMGAFNDIPASAETNTKSIFKTITSMINNYKPPTKTIKVNADTSGLEKSIMGAVQGVFITLGIGHTSGGRKGAKGLIFNPPKLARGGIINRPGRGVNYRSATIGERGREAVVPLTDSQQMSLLGQEIAKNVVINLTNVTELDGRVLARNVTQVMNDMNFASNGGVI